MPKTTTEKVVNLFAEELSLHASGKRPYLNDDGPNTMRQEVESLEIEQVEAAKQALIVDEMVR